MNTPFNINGFCVKNQIKLTNFIRNIISISLLHLLSVANISLSIRYTVPTKLLGTPPYFQCILMALRVLEKCNNS